MKFVVAMFRADDSIEPRERSRLIALLKNGGTTAEQTSRMTAPKVVQRAEAARMLGRSLRLVDSLARRGLLRRVKLPGQQRALGLRADDVQNLVESATVAADDAGKAAA
jgi:hypothetical protein